MGLDNGIMIKKPYNEIIKETPCFVLLDDFYAGKQETEIVYFRKFWTWRYNIMLSLHMGDEDYRMKLDAEDIDMIARITKKFIDKDYYNEKGDGFGWDYEDRFDSIFRAYINLLWLKDYKEKNPDIEVYFYDSY